MECNIHLPKKIGNGTRTNPTPTPVFSDAIGIFIQTSRTCHFSYLRTHSPLRLTLPPEQKVSTSPCRQLQPLHRRSLLLCSHPVGRKLVERHRHILVETTVVRVYAFDVGSLHRISSFRPHSHHELIEPGTCCILPRYWHWNSIAGERGWVARRGAAFDQGKPRSWAKTQLRSHRGTSRPVWVYAA